MNKFAVFASLAAVAAGGAAAVPYYVGNQAQAAVSDGRTHQHGDLQLSHVLSEYRRGYLSSSAESTLTVTVQDEPVTLAAEHRIEHVFAPRVHSTYRIAPEDGELQQALYSVFGDSPVLVSDSTLKGGGVAVDVRMPEQSRVLANRLTRLEFAGMEGSFTIRDQQLSGRFDFEPLRLFDDEGSIDLSGQLLVLDGLQLGGVLNPGKLSYQAEALQLRADGDAVALREVELVSTQTVAGDNIGGEFAFRAGRLETPEGSLSDVAARVKVDNIHRELLEFLLEQQANAAAGSGSNPAAADIPQPMLVRFLENAPEASFRFALGPDSDVKAAFEWDVLYRNPASAPPDPDRPESLIAGLRTTALATFKPEMLEEIARLTEGEYGSAADIAAVLAALEADGYVSRDAKGYRIKVGFANGSILVNDVPRPELMMMLGMLLAQ